MFQFPEFALQTYVFSLQFLDVTPGWFPYSEIAGSKFAYNSPTLIAVSHVFHRFRLPRHPPYTLSSLAIKLLEYPKDMTRINAFHSSIRMENLYYKITKFQRALQNSIESEKLFYWKNFFIVSPTKLVEVNGIEPMTFTVQAWRSPSWATPPY